MSHVVRVIAGVISSSSFFSRFNFYTYECFNYLLLACIIARYNYYYHLYIDSVIGLTGYGRSLGRSQAMVVAVVQATRSKWLPELRDPSLFDASSTTAVVILKIPFVLFGSPILKHELHTAIYYYHLFISAFIDFLSDTHM